MYIYFFLQIQRPLQVRRRVTLMMDLQLFVWASTHSHPRFLATTPRHGWLPPITAIVHSLALKLPQHEDLLPLSAGHGCHDQHVSKCTVSKFHMFTYLASHSGGGFYLWKQDNLISKSPTKIICKRKRSDQFDEGSWGRKLPQGKNRP